MSLSAIINPLDKSTYLIFYLDKNNNVAFTSTTAVSPTHIQSSNQINANDDTSVAVGNMVANTALAALYLNNMINVYGFYKGTPSTGSTDAGPKALAQIVPGFVKLVSDANLLSKSQLAGCTNSDNTEGMLFYVTTGGNLTAYNLLDQEPKVVVNQVEAKSNLAAAWGAIGSHDSVPHVAYQKLTPDDDSVYDIVIINTTTKATATIVADSMFPAPLAITFANGRMYLYYFSMGKELKRASFESYNDENPKVIALTDAPKINTATQMTAIVNAPKNNKATITLYYIGKNNNLAGYES